MRYKIDIRSVRFLPLRYEAVLLLRNQNNESYTGNCLQHETVCVLLLFKEPVAQGDPFVLAKASLSC